MLVATNLSKQFVYKESKGLFKKIIVKNAVNDVSLKIESGKIVGLIGVNGAGKTTTIKMLASLIKPSTGEILIDNLDIIKEHKKAKRIINLISGGERNIYWRLTAQENLEYFGALYGIPKDVLNQRIETILEMVGLTESKDIPVERYSKGMKQRLQIARGLINDPKYIFLDEPTLGLDINIAKELRLYIRKLR
ncbi:ABC transporter ATP-binding protein [Bacillus sp. OR9]|nr:ABC transporter ATP-binding protein [Bacillus sp. OR9]